MSAIVIISMSVLFIVGLYAAVALFVGGLIGYLSSLSYSWVALKPIKETRADKVVSRFYKGEAVKFVVLFLLFFTALKIIDEISQIDYAIYLLAGLIISLLIQNIGPVVIKQASN